VFKRGVTGRRTAAAGVEVGVGGSAAMMAGECPGHLCPRSLCPRHLCPRNQYRRSRFLISRWLSSSGTRISGRVGLRTTAAPIRC